MFGRVCVPFLDNYFQLVSVCHRVSVAQQTPDNKYTVTISFQVTMASGFQFQNNLPSSLAASIYFQKVNKEIQVKLF